MSVETKNCFYRLDVDEHDSPESIAQIIRASWGLPLGPVTNLVSAIELAGGIVVQCDFGTDKIDAVSQWPRNTAPLFFVNKDIPTDRWRFSLAHELGHLIMHAVPTENAEKEADRFASEFLMPEREIADELDKMTLAKAAQRKPYWRVSMQALIRRAKDLGRITENQYRYLCSQINKEGYRFDEPEPIAPEYPTVVQDLITTYQQHFGYTIPQLSAYVLSREDHFRRLLMNEAQPRLRLLS